MSLTKIDESTAAFSVVRGTDGCPGCFVAVRVDRIGGGFTFDGGGAEHFWSLQRFVRAEAG